jgi:SNF2 family DNA or RNA helicase
MSIVQEQFETIINKRMERFHYLLEKAKFQFKQYQYDGVKWCVENELRHNPPGNVRGGFIADEMGLGKTIMMIGTMYVNFLPHTLIVVPPVLINQWFNELYRTSNHKALMYYKTDKKYITQEQINSAPIVLTTYNTLLQPNCLLKNLSWNRVIYDEGHHLRNSNTKRYDVCKQLRARVRWLVSGTPIQNKKKDFYNLCCAIGMRSVFYTLVENMITIGKYFVLRRTKQQVGIDLPPLNKHKYIIPWKNYKEMRLSEEIHSLIPKQSFVSVNKRHKIANSLYKEGILSYLLRARQICIFPELLRNKLELICEETLEALKFASKIDTVIDVILERKNNGRGKIIFCHFRKEIDFIHGKLTNGGMKKIIKYDGRNSGGENLIKLAEPADALIIQIQTGCEGLNLQHNFSEIYFVSPHWNPSIEDQAIARCHRIGQNKEVDVFKFEMCGFYKDDTFQVEPVTLDTYVNNIQDIKRDISRTILGN